MKQDNWISIEDALPKIPKGKYGIHVLVAAFDSTYEEINSGCGYSVYEYGYLLTIDRYGNKRKGYEVSALVADFMEIASDGSAYPSGDPITHWQYKPEPPHYETK